MRRILIVEDEVIIRQALKKLLERNDYHVDDAGTVDDALKFPVDDYDLVISDLRLPGRPGTDLLKEIKSSRAHHDQLCQFAFRGRCHA